MGSRRYILPLIYKLALGHVFIILLSNVLVQYPFTFLGLHTTWGAITYPVVFILTDLTTRVFSPSFARRVVLISMVPGLLLSYFISSYFESLSLASGLSLFSLHIMPLRIACACFVAYVAGQILDILVFQRFRNRDAWWVAPAISSGFGNLLDTVLFFSIAFYNCSDPFLRSHWVEIAMVDMSFKLLISLFAFVPLYGVILNNYLGLRQSSS